MGAGPQGERGCGVPCSAPVGDTGWGQPQDRRVPAPLLAPRCSCPISRPAPGTATQRQGLITAEIAFPVQEASAGMSSAGPGHGAEGNWLPVTRSISRLRNAGPSPLGFSGEGERFVKPSAGICPSAAASPLPRGWVYSKKPVELAELPGLSTQQRVAARPRPEREGRGPRTAVRAPGPLLGSSKAGAVPTGLGSGRGCGAWPLQATRLLSPGGTFPALPHGGVL